LVSCRFFVECCGVYYGGLIIYLDMEYSSIDCEDRAPDSDRGEQPTLLIPKADRAWI
jgi:hypothetical protein